MNKNSENPRVGREFQELTATLLGDYYGIEFNTEIAMMIGNPAKAHRFDCVSTDGKIAVECKCYTWTHTGNIPSAKLGFLNQSVLYASLLPIGVKRVIAMKRSLHPRRPETLAEYYYRTYQHLLSGIVLLEIDAESKTVKPIGETLPSNNEIVHLYMIARRQPLIIGKEYTLPKSGRSPHGDTYWSDVPFFRKNEVVNHQVVCHLVEHMFEQVRLAEFPNQPSRFSSVFASTAEQFAVWQNKINAENTFPVFEIQASTFQVFDGALLKCLGGDKEGTIYFEPSFARGCARLYWSGCRVQEYPEFAEAVSEMECLVQYPFKVTKQLTEKEILRLAQIQF